ncbi:MAG: hypothetical protein ABIC40_06540, partial [bacterium]
MNDSESDRTKKMKAAVEAVLTDTFLSLAILVTRVISASGYLHKWDSVQFALALSNYDIHRHQPHPLGYPGYIGLAWIIRKFVPDDNTALVIVGVLSSVIIAVTLHRLARSVWGTRAGIIAGIIAVVNPLDWYFSSVALSYISGAAVAAVAAHAAWSSSKKTKWVIPLAAGFSSIFWPYAGVLVFPVALWGFMRHADKPSHPENRFGISFWAEAVKFSALFAIPVLLAYIPVIVHTGGWASFMSEVLSESDKHVVRFSGWVQRPMSEFLSTTGSIGEFLMKGFGIGRWLFLALLIPITGEKGCESKKVVFLLPLGIMGYALIHWGKDPVFITIG